MRIDSSYEVPPELATAIDDLLVASVRPRHYIHDRCDDDPPDSRTGWMVSC